MIHNLYLQKESEKILKLILISEKSFEEDDEMKSHLAKYICILCSGFIENAIHNIYIDYVQKEIKNDNIISYFNKSINRINTPLSDKLKEIAKSFNIDWEIEMKAFLHAEERSTSLNYIIRERNNIAHGKDSDITLIRIREYHIKTLEIIGFIERQCELTPNDI